MYQNNALVPVSGLIPGTIKQVVTLCELYYQSIVKASNITFYSILTHKYHLYFLEVFTYLPQSHGCVTEQFLLFNLLVKNFCENHLKCHSNSGLIQVLLEHFCLSFSLSSLIADLNNITNTSSYPPDYYDF